MITINCTLKLTTEMLGTIPKNKEIYESYIETKRPDGGSDEVDIEAIEEKGWTGFHSDENGIFIFDYMIKGFLKHWGNVLKDELKIKAMRSKIDDVLFIFPRKIYPQNEKGETIKEPTGLVERPLRAMTMQGPRVSLARSDYLPVGTSFKFSIELINTGKKEITADIIKELLAHGKYAGLGQFRNGGYGRFEVIEFEEK